MNELYVALVKRPDAPHAKRGKVADDFARLPTAFRWIPGEELELPFTEYVSEEDRSRDRRLQPDAMLEDPARKRRYLIEYETGSATVRNTHHKTATLTKLARYSQFILGFAEVHGRATYYSNTSPTASRRLCSSSRARQPGATPSPRRSRAGPGARSTRGSRSAL